MACPIKRRLALALLLAGFYGTASLPSHSAPSEPETVVAGAKLFTDSGCPQCHGPAGQGTQKGPSLRDLRKRLKPDATRRQIHDGGTNMPPFGDALPDDQINALVDFLQAKNGWKLLSDGPPSPAPR